MHEYTIAKNIIETAENAASGRKIGSISIEMGELADLPKEDLLNALKLIKDYEYKITEIGSKIKCVCGFQGSPKIIEKKHASVIFVCPNCSKVPEVIEGNEINIKEIDVED